MHNSFTEQLDFIIFRLLTHAYLHIGSYNMLYDFTTNNTLFNKDKEEEKHRIIRQMRLKAQEKKEQEALIAKDEREQQEKEERQQESSQKAQLVNPHWIHKDKNANDTRPDYTYIGDTIKLIVDQQHADNKSITFKIHDNLMPMSMDPNRLVQEKKTKVESPSPEIEWKVSDPRNKRQPNRDMDVYFLAMCSEEEYSDNCEILIKERIKELFHFSM